MLSIRRNFSKWRYFKETEPDYTECEIDCSKETEPDYAWCEVDLQNC